MKSFTLIVLLTLTAWSTACSESPQAQSPAPQPVFPIGGFSPKPERDKAAGFTLAGPVYSRKKEMLAECEAVGMPFLYPVGVKLEFSAKAGGEEPDHFDFSAIQAEIRQQVEEVAASNSIFSWYLIPEELRYWKPLELEYLRVASETIREADPKKRPIWMYEPNHRTTGALVKTLPWQQMAGKGLYVNFVGRKNERAWLAWSLNQQKTAMDTGAPDALPLAVPEMFREPDPEDLPLIRTWVRHDSYAALLGGARAIVIYSFANRKGFSARADYYEAYAGVARELNGDLALGPVFLLGQPAAPPAFRLVEGRETTTLSARKSSPTEEIQVPALQTKAYTLNGKNYVFLINSTPEPMTLAFEEKAAWQPVFPDQTALISENNTLKLTPWEVAAFQKPL